jgi:hypothetical protein
MFQVLEVTTAAAGGFDTSYMYLYYRHYYRHEQSDTASFFSIGEEPIFWSMESAVGDGGIPESGYGKANSCSFS